jgi:hypothetical protein
MGRPFVLFPSSASLLTQLRDTSKVAALRGFQSAGSWPAGVEVTPASRLEVRPAPEMVSSGIHELDALTGGWPRGCLTEICGSASSGRTSVLLAALAQATQRGEACAMVDSSDALDPASAAAAGVVMGRLLWIRCGKQNSPQSHPSTSFRAGSVTEKLNQKSLRGVFFKETEFDRKRKSFEKRLEQVLKITDLLLQSNGFGMIVLDLADIPVRSARRIPLASWFRFRRAVEHTPTVLLVIEQQPIAGSCSSVLLQVSGVGSQASGKKPSAFSSQQFANRGMSLARAGASEREILSVREIDSDQEISGGRGIGLTYPSHTELLDQFEITAELLRSRLERKPSQAVASFRSRAKWAG